MYINKDFNHSYWEKKHVFTYYDFVIVGAGIVGLSTAISLKTKYKKAKVLIMEAGILPTGASTKNAGFACFGSAGELLDDLKEQPESLVMETVKMRIEGLQLLRQRLGDKHLNYKAHGGFEIFDKKSEFEYCLSKLSYLNQYFKKEFGLVNCYKKLPSQTFEFKKIKGLIKNRYEGQLDSGLMIKNLSQLAYQKGVETLFACKLLTFESLGKGVGLNTTAGEFKCGKLVIATNGFAKSLINELDVKPARAQVLITKEIKHLKLKGSFHFDKGYYYFRNVDNRVLLGGGRNLDFKKESTYSFDLNTKIQASLDEMLKEIILPHTPFEIDYRWTGIMGVGKEKKPIITYHSKNVIVAVRMGGMGVAIGSMVGEKVAQMV